VSVRTGPQILLLSDVQMDRPARSVPGYGEMARRQVRLRARRRTGVSFGVLIVGTVAVLIWSLAFGSAGAGHATGLRGNEVSVRYSLPRIDPAVDLAANDTGGASVPAMPFPKKGEGAVAVTGTGTIAESKDERPVPIASVTKIMTAYLVLKAHPLAGDEQGPSLRFTEADHLAWIGYSERDDSNVEIVKGESLTERQLLEALLIPSADNVADILARWVGGSEARFVAEMNTTAASLGMSHTHYADASGVDPHSVSTAADQALLASIVMANPVFRSIVALPDVAFPVAGHIWNYNPVLGEDGIIGVKSGFTQAAGGCLVTAAWRHLGDRSVLLVAAVTGQPWGLWQAGQQDEALLKAATVRLQLLSPYGNEVDVAEVKVPWSHATVVARLSEPLQLSGWGGLQLAGKLVGATVTEANLHDGWAAGSVIGWLQVTSRYGPVATLPVTLGRAIAPPPAGSVVLHGAVSLAASG
jgi:D-alanyl-D-alanine carboxypeptidase (penicillin-binding protein 5/6)